MVVPRTFPLAGFRSVRDTLLGPGSLIHKPQLRLTQSQPVSIVPALSAAWKTKAALIAKKNMWMWIVRNKPRAIFQGGGKGKRPIRLGTGWSTQGHKKAVTWLALHQGQLLPACHVSFTHDGNETTSTQTAGERHVDGDHSPLL